MSEPLGKKEKKEILKGLIRRLHQGASREEIGELKARFGEVLRSITPLEIAQIEEELVREGMPKEEVQKLCDVHLALFRESLEKAETLADKWAPNAAVYSDYKKMFKESRLDCVTVTVPNLSLIHISEPTRPY